MADAESPDGGAQVDRLQVARRQAVLAVAGLILIAATIVLPNLIVAHDGWMEALRAERYQHSRQMLGLPFFRLTATCHVLYDDVPHADTSRGGVYLIGSSTLLTSIDPLAENAAKSAGIHNYCQYAQTATQAFQFVRYLVEQEGLLKAAGERTGVLLGLTFTDIMHLNTTQPGVWSQGFTASGIYAYDPVSGIERVPMAPIAYDCRLWRFRAQSFWSWIGIEVGKHLRGGEPGLQPAEFASSWQRKFGTHWSVGMAAEMAQLAQMIAYLKERQVHIQVVFTPERAWCREFAPALAYHQAAAALMEREQVPVIDLTALLPEADFADSVHVNHDGTAVESPLILAAARALMAPPGKAP